MLCPGRFILVESVCDKICDKDFAFDLVEDDEENMLVIKSEL